MLLQSSQPAKYNPDHFAAHAMQDDTRRYQYGKVETECPVLSQSVMFGMKLHPPVRFG